MPLVRSYSFSCVALYVHITSLLWVYQIFNTLRPRQNGRIFRTTFSNAFSWMKMYEFHWILFRRVQLTIFQHWIRSWLGTVQGTSHYLKQCWLVYWRINASLGLNELTKIFPYSSNDVQLSSNLKIETYWIIPCVEQLLHCITVQNKWMK